MYARFMLVISSISREEIGLSDRHPNTVEQLIRFLSGLGLLPRL